MIKSMISINLFTPLLFNMLMMLMIMIPSKINKFHPLTLMIILILLTFLICNKLMFIYQSWIPFILFLTMIGGLMIIFMYITSLANNELFFINFKNILMQFFKILPLMMMMLTMFLIYNQMMYFNLNNQDMWTINLSNYIFDKMNFSIMYKQYNNKTTYFIMIYLYFSMICIMNICYKFKAPLRQLMF